MNPSIQSAIRAHRPLIHCITNPISIHQCANAILALGARPIMAEHPREAAEITQTADALLLNLGNITDARMESIRLSAAAAAEKQIPVVLDAVGIACSWLRRDFTDALLEQFTPTVIKGNYSEIMALCGGYRAAGVDAESTLEPAAVSRAAVGLAKSRGTIILASGKTDVITDSKRLFHLKNGTPQLAAVTGTGCMLGALCASCLAVRQELSAVVTACALLSICGQLAETDRGTGSFAVALMDQLSTVTAEQLEKYLKLEEIPIESI